MRSKNPVSPILAGLGGDSAGRGKFHPTGERTPGQTYAVWHQVCHPARGRSRSQGGALVPVGGHRRGGRRGPSCAGDFATGTVPGGREDCAVASRRAVSDSTPPGFASVPGFIRPRARAGGRPVPRRRCCFFVSPRGEWTGPARNVGRAPPVMLQCGHLNLRRETRWRSFHRT